MFSDILFEKFVDLFSLQANKESINEILAELFKLKKCMQRLFFSSINPYFITIIIYEKLKIQFFQFLRHILEVKQNIS